MKKSLLGASSVCAVLCALNGMADVVDRPSGFKIGERMTLKPYVDISFVIDSNPDSQHDGECGCCWVINPGLTLDYKAENWSIDLGAYYRYSAYHNYANQLNDSSFGENLRYQWSNAKANEKGWTLMLSESYQYIAADDNMLDNNGRGLWRNRQQVNIAGVIERRFTDKLHADINAAYDWLDYINDENSYGALYGWSRWTAGLGAGYALSQWTDVLLSANYQRYYQDNSQDLTGYASQYANSRQYGGESQGVSLMVGLGSYATERISYRAMAGWSYFEYGDEISDNGFTYSVSAQWKISDTLSTMLLAESHYQPSETEYGSANRVDGVSWGIAKSLVRGKLNSTFDIAYRRDTCAMNDVSARDYDMDELSARLGFNYAINRFLVAFLNFEYQGIWYEGDTGNVDRDYNRFRGTLGLRLTY